MTEKERDQLRMIAEWMPYQGCQDNKYIRQCFVISEEDCQGMTEVSSSSCLKMYQSEWMKPGAGPMSMWQQKIVDCAVRDLRVKLKSRAVDNMYCKNKGDAR